MIVAVCVTAAIQLVPLSRCTVSVTLLPTRLVGVAVPVIVTLLPKGMAPLVRPLMVSVSCGVTVLVTVKLVALVALPVIAGCSPGPEDLTGIRSIASALALPVALAGIVWMLFLTHTTVSVPALTGAIMCMGVATANASGAYSLVLPPGSYKLFVAPVTAGHPQQWFGGNTFATATAIAVVANTVQNVAVP